MRHIYVNFKRFDVPVSEGGVNRLAPVESWSQVIVDQVRDELNTYDSADIDFTFFFPEAHLMTAALSIRSQDVLKLGCQGICGTDLSDGGNFGALTTLRPAASAKALGCQAVLIGHCEERNHLTSIMRRAGADDIRIRKATKEILHEEIQSALARGLDVLYCIGEKLEEQDHWEDVLGLQLSSLEGLETSRVVIGYEPVWSIGPGRTPADAPYIQKIARFVRMKTNGIDVVYGGGLKTENAAMIAQIPEVSGGLIALTRFAGEIGFYPDEFLQIVKRYTEAL